MTQKPAPIPFHAEPLAALQERFPAALKFVYDQQAIAVGNAIRPGEVAAQVFDFEDGLRLLVSREKDKVGKIVLHVSASFEDECRIADEMRAWLKTTPKFEAMLKWANTIPQRFAELAKDDGPPIELIGWSNRMIPHYHREEKASVPG